MWEPRPAGCARRSCAPDDLEHRAAAASSGVHVQDVRRVLDAAAGRPRPLVLVALVLGGLMHGPGVSSMSRMKHGAAATPHRGHAVLQGQAQSSGVKSFTYLNSRLRVKQPPITNAAPMAAMMDTGPATAALRVSCSTQGRHMQQATRVTCEPHCGKGPGLGAPPPVMWAAAGRPAVPRPTRHHRPSPPSCGQLRHILPWPIGTQAVPKET